jgi:transcriptional regulator with XRE-family HTH domain
MEAKKALQLNVIALRKKFNMTQIEFADKCGITQRLVSDIELGKAWPENKAIQSIAKGCGVEETDLYTDPEMLTALEYLIKRKGQT